MFRARSSGITPRRHSGARLVPINDRYWRRSSHQQNPAIKWRRNVLPPTPSARRRNDGGSRMRTWVYSPHAGGKSIPFAIKIRTERRILDYGAKHYPGKFTRIDVRFRGALCYIDVYSEPDLPRGSTPPPGETRDQWIDRLRNTPTHLCRIRYFGNEDRLSFAWYT